jgi:hypothetical protein
MSYLTHFYSLIKKQQNAGIFLTLLTLLLFTIAAVKTPPTTIDYAASIPTSRAYQYAIPTFHVDSVNQDADVTITTKNFPPNMEFTLTMGEIWTQGINGIVVTTFNSGAGGTNTYTFNIPPELHGRRQLSIRAQTKHAYPFYAYNWFYNVPAPVSRPLDQTLLNYRGIPTIKICEVSRNNFVVIETNNFPPNQEFTPYLSRTDGSGVHTGMPFNSEDGSTKRHTFTIPPTLAGQYKISVRVTTAHQYPYHAYNWFFNNTATVC